MKRGEKGRMQCRLKLPGCTNPRPEGAKANSPEHRPGWWDARECDALKGQKLLHLQRENPTRMPSIPRALPWAGGCWPFRPSPTAGGFLNPSQPFSTPLNPSQPLSTLLNPSQPFSTLLNSAAGASPLSTPHELPPFHCQANLQ